MDKKTKAVKKAVEVVVPRVAKLVPPVDDRREARARLIRKAIGLKF